MISVVIALSILSPVMVFIAYRQGLKDGRQVSSDKPLEPIVSLPKPTPKLTPEQIKWAAVWDNINNYNGTPNGQKEVK